MIYLASPYSNKSSGVQVQRFQQACYAAARLMRSGFRIFSPIAHTHPIATIGGLPKGWDFWQKYDLEMISACEAVFVLMLTGWRESTGVMAEIEIARQQNKRVAFVDADTLEIAWETLRTLPNAKEQG